MIKILLLLLLPISLFGRTVRAVRKTPEGVIKIYNQEFGINKYTEMVFGTWEIEGYSIKSEYGEAILESGEEGTCCNKCKVQGTLGTINRCVGTNCGKPKCRNCGSNDEQYCSKPIDLPDWSTFTEEKFQEYLKKHGLLNARYLPIFDFLHDCKEFNELIKNYQKPR